MKLYTHALSPFSAKVRIALAEKQLDYQEIALPITRTAVIEKPAELLAINPRGEVPTLIDGDVRLYDSTVILEYLEDRYPSPPLYPRDCVERARARLLEDEGDWLLATCVGVLIDEVYRKTDPAARDAERIDAASRDAQQVYARLDALLGERESFCDDFGVADIALFIPIRIAAFCGVAPAAEQKRLSRWFELTSGRPSVKREIDAQLRFIQELPA